MTQKKSKLKKICFFITPIGKAGSEERKRADQVQKFILTEVLGAKYKIVRADELPHPGSITHQIIHLLYNADLVVADLTGSNANVAYELAVRHAFNKLSIHLIDKADTIPFDLKDERTIVFDINDLDSIKSCKDELKKSVQAVSAEKVAYRSPVFRALGVEAATSEEREKFFEKLVDQIDSLASNVSDIESTISYANLDQIDSIADGVDSVGSQNAALAVTVKILDTKVQKILDKLG